MAVLGGPWHLARQVCNTHDDRWRLLHVFQTSVIMFLPKTRASVQNKKILRLCAEVSKLWVWAQFYVTSGRGEDRRFDPIDRAIHVVWQAGVARSDCLFQPRMSRALHGGDCCSIFFKIARVKKLMEHDRYHKVIFCIIMLSDKAA